MSAQYENNNMVLNHQTYNHTEIDDLESHTQEYTENEQHSSVSNQKKSSIKKIAIITFVAIASVVVAIAITTLFACKGGEENEVVVENNNTTGEVNTTENNTCDINDHEHQHAAQGEENAGAVIGVSGDEAQDSEEISMVQWGLIGAGAYLCSNMLCAALSTMVVSCCCDSVSWTEKEQKIKQRNDITTDAEWEAYKKTDAYKEDTKDIPCCCVACSLEEKGMSGGCILCQTWVFTTLWNALTFNVCSIMPCIIAGMMNDDCDNEEGEKCCSVCNPDKTGACACCVENYCCRGCCEKGWMDACACKSDEDGLASSPTTTSCTFTCCTDDSA